MSGNVPPVGVDVGFVVVHFAGQSVDVGFVVCNVLAIRFDVGFVDLHSPGQSNDIIIYAHHIRCLVKPLESGTFYPGERFDRQFVNDSRTGLQRGRLNVLRDYQRAGGQCVLQHRRDLEMPIRRHPY